VTIARSFVLAPCSLALPRAAPSRGLPSAITVAPRAKAKTGAMHTMTSAGSSGAAHRARGTLKSAAGPTGPACNTCAGASARAVRTHRTHVSGTTRYYLTYVWACLVCGESWLDGELARQNQESESLAQEAAERGLVGSDGREVERQAL